MPRGDHEPLTSLKKSLAALPALQRRGEQISLIVLKTAVWQDGAAPDIPQAAQLCHQVQQSAKG